jgi:hypothetical protein
MRKVVWQLEVSWASFGLGWIVSLVAEIYLKPLQSSGFFLLLIIEMKSGKEVEEYWKHNNYDDGINEKMKNDHHHCDYYDVII